MQVLVSPLADAPVRADLDFEVPSCYKHNPPRLQPGYLAKFKEETLFYIFYSMPQVGVPQGVHDRGARVPQGEDTFLVFYSMPQMFCCIISYSCAL